MVLDGWIHLLWPGSSRQALRRLWLVYNNALSASGSARIRSHCKDCKDCEILWWRGFSLWTGQRCTDCWSPLAQTLIFWVSQQDFWLLLQAMWRGSISYVSGPCTIHTHTQNKHYYNYTNTSINNCTHTMCISRIIQHIHTQYIHLVCSYLFRNHLHICKVGFLKKTVKREANWHVWEGHIWNMLKWGSLFTSAVRSV